jgi:enoyl-CoA hydratase/carnithine racemase
MTYDTIQLAREADGIAVCTFNRPEVRNAISLEMVTEVRAMLAELALDEDVRALIFTGAGGKAFVSGADIAELRERKRGDALRRINSNLCRDIEEFPRPTIAAITGFALGGGCEVALACDMRIAGASAKLGQPEVSLGILPGAGATYRLPRAVGHARARELIFTGRIIDAAEAERIGLLNRVVADDRVLDEARALARAIAANSAWAVRLAKQAIASGIEMSTDASMAYESTAQAVLFEDEDKHRRMTAFLEKRKEKR